MNLKDLSLDISRSFVEEYYPEHMEVLDRYAKLWSSDLKTQTPSKTSDRLGSSALLASGIAQIVLGVVANLIFELLKRRLKRGEKAGHQQIDPKKLEKLDLRKLEETKIKLMKSTNRPELVEEITAYTLDYIEIHYEKSESESREA